MWPPTGHTRLELMERNGLLVQLLRSESTTTFAPRSRSPRTVPSQLQQGYKYRPIPVRHVAPPMSIFSSRTPTALAGASLLDPLFSPRSCTGITPAPQSDHQLVASSVPSPLFFIDVCHAKRLAGLILSYRLLFRGLELTQY